MGIESIRQVIYSTPWKIEIKKEKTFVAYVIFTKAQIKKNDYDIMLRFMPEKYRETQKESIKDLNTIFGSQEELSVYYVKELVQFSEGGYGLAEYYATYENNVLFPLKYQFPSDESFGNYIIKRAIRGKQAEIIKVQNATETPYTGLYKVVKIKKQKGE